MKSNNIKNNASQSRFFKITSTKLSVRSFRVFAFEYFETELCFKEDSILWEDLS